MIDEVVSLDVVCDVEPSFEHAKTQEEEAGHGPQPPQGGAGLHGAIAAAAQRGGGRAGGSKVHRSIWEAICIWFDSGDCCDDVERPKPRAQDKENGALDADRACIGGEEGEEKEVEAQRVRHLPPYETTNGGLDRLVRPQHDRRGRTNHQ